MCAHSAFMALVVDHTFASVSRVHGRAPARSAEPPQRSTTSSPFQVAANDAPTSFSTAKFFANASFTFAKRASQRPWMTALVVFMVAAVYAAPRALRAA